MALRTETLASYRTKVLRELRDANQSYFNSQNGANPNLDLNTWINEAVAWRDLWSGGARVYKPQVALTTGVDFYVLSGPQAGALFPTDTILDIPNAWLIWGNFRRPMKELPFGVVTWGYRHLVQYTDVPGAFCRYGANQLVVATAPSFAYTMDLDATTLSIQFATDGTQDAVQDPLQYPYTEPVIKYAAYLAKQNQRRFDEANVFYNEAVRALGDIEASRVGELPQPTKG